MSRIPSWTSRQCARAGFGCAQSLPIRGSTRAEPTRRALGFLGRGRAAWRRWQFIFIDRRALDPSAFTPMREIARSEIHEQQWSQGDAPGARRRCRRGRQRNRCRRCSGRRLVAQRRHTVPSGRRPPRKSARAARTGRRPATGCAKISSKRTRRVTALLVGDIVIGIAGGVHAGL